jgi:peptidoglycan/xylan/chitin deacetylase (PgdA/CDA1 family)
MALIFRPVVLCYHAVTDQWSHPLAVGVDTVERQVRRLLRRGYRPAAASEVLPGRGRLLHVTFDDAYRSVDRALSVLQRLGVPATVFACTDHAADGKPMDVPDLTAYPSAPRDELATMSWDDLRALANAGVEVGSHTVTHASLTQLSDHELKRELLESRETLEDELGRPCRLLAYPYGDEDVHSAVRAAGDEAGFSLPGRVWPVNAYSVPRVGIFRPDGMLRATLKGSALRAVPPSFRRVTGERTTS